jgi:hypothetical protein
MNDADTIYRAELRGRLMGIVICDGGDEELGRAVAGWVDLVRRRRDCRSGDNNKFLASALATEIDSLAEGDDDYRALSTRLATAAVNALPPWHEHN